MIDWKCLNCGMMNIERKLSERQKKHADKIRKLEKEAFPEMAKTFDMFEDRWCYHCEAHNTIIEGKVVSSSPKHD